MKKFIVILATGLLAMQFMGCAGKPRAASEPQIDLVARGKYLVTTGLCHDCHSPKVFGPQGEPMPDSTRLLSGHPAELPYPDWTPADLQKRISAPRLQKFFGEGGKRQIELDGRALREQQRPVERHER